MMKLTCSILVFVVELNIPPEMLLFLETFGHVNPCFLFFLFVFFSFIIYVLKVEQLIISLTFLLPRGFTLIKMLLF